MSTSDSHKNIIGSDFRDYAIVFVDERVAVWNKVGMEDVEPHVLHTPQVLVSGSREECKSLFSFSSVMSHLGKLRPKK